MSTNNIEFDEAESKASLTMMESSEMEPITITTDQEECPIPLFQIGEEAALMDESSMLSADDNSDNSQGTLPASLAGDEVEKMTNIEKNAEIEPSPLAAATTEPDSISLTPSEGGDSSSTKTKVKTPNRVQEVVHVIVQPADIIEYEWPQKSGDRFFVQEQISELLAISSFKRKYPEMFRRTIEPKERDYLLKELKINVGLAHHLTALHSAEVHELMTAEYPEIYAEYQKACNERLKQMMLEKQKELNAIKMDAKKMADLRQKAIRNVSEFNAELQAVRKFERKQYWDLNTNIIHSPLNKWMRMAPQYTKPTKYPVFCVPGQYTTYYKRFAPSELRNMPLNTVLTSTAELFPPKKDASPPPICVTDEEIADAIKAADEAKGKQTQEKKEPLPTSSTTPSTSNGIGIGTPTGLKRSIKQEPPNVPQKETPVFPPPPKMRKMSSNNNSGNGSSGNNKRNNKAPTLPEYPKSAQMGSSLPPKMPTLLPNVPTVVAPSPKNTSQPTTPPQLAAICSICQQLDSTPKSMPVRCSACHLVMHSSCIDMPPSMVEVIRRYDWLCIDCKRCCVCEQPDQEAAMMCCDQCDRGYHTFCIGLDQPPNGTWHCPECKGE